MENNEIRADEIKHEPCRKIKVVYQASESVTPSVGIQTVELSAEIDDIKDFSSTYDLLQSLALEKLNLRSKHSEIVQEYEKTRIKYLELVKQLESATKQWELVSNFLKTQGLKTDTAEFPSEALTNLSKSLPTISSGYPE